jgi:hypothetical protein
MSKSYPECPREDHTNCQEISNPRVCAIVREDLSCLMEPSKEKMEKSAVDSLKENFKTRKI